MSEFDGGRPATPEDIHPEPTSFTLKANILRAADGPAIRIDILTVTGTTVLFGRPQDILDTFGMVMAIAETAKRTLIVPPGAMGGPERPQLQ
jgi:hypothetical protein